MGRADKIAIIAVVGDGTLDEGIVDLLCRAGRYDCVLTSDANAGLLRSRLLAAPAGWYPPNSGKEPLYLLPMFLSQPTTPFEMDRVFYRNHHISDVLERFREARSNRTPDLAFAFDFSQQAVELSCKISDLAGDGRFRQADALEWGGIVEECRQVLGDWPAILAAANQIARMRRGRGKRVRRANLASRDRTICDRIRTAKSQAKNASWWREQLLQAVDASDQFLFHLTLWSWATPEIVFEIAGDVAANLDELAPEEWSTLVSFLPHALEHAYFGVASGQHENQPLPQRLQSRRFAFLMGIKAPDLPPGTGHSV